LAPRKPVARAPEIAVVTSIARRSSSSRAMHRADPMRAFRAATVRCTTPPYAALRQPTPDCASLRWIATLTPPLFPGGSRYFSLSTLRSVSTLVVADALPAIAGRTSQGTVVAPSVPWIGGPAHRFCRERGFTSAGVRRGRSRRVIAGKTQAGEHAQPRAARAGIRRPLGGGRRREHPSRDSRRSLGEEKPQGRGGEGGSKG